MPYYIVESPAVTITIRGTSLHGVPTIGHSRPLWLYVVSTEDNPLDWPESPTGRGTGHRRAPIGVENWWVVVESGAKALSEGGLRSDGKPFDTRPPGYPVFNWPTEMAPDEADAGSAALADDLNEILTDNSIGITEKEFLIKARIGQGAFRREVLRQWDHRCAVTGSWTLEAVRASHIKPWRVSKHDERLDPNNGLPLVASLDALFDAGLISFDLSGSLIVSPELNSSERQVFAVTGRSLRKAPSTVTANYLEHHRNHVFRR